MLVRLPRRRRHIAAVEASCCREDRSVPTRAPPTTAGSPDPWDYFVAGTYLHSDGWRDFSSSRIEQVFGKVGYETGDFDADLSYTFANNNLQGTQTSPLSLLAVDPALAYTYPDITNNLLNGFNLQPLEGAGDRQDPRRATCTTAGSRKTTSAAT